MPLGTQIGLDITDAGRLSLGGTMGPEIGRIEGRLLSKDSAEYVLAVSLIHLLRGGEQVWSGERIRIKTEHVAHVSQRTLSKGRTAAMALATLGVVVIIARQSLVGSLFLDSGRPPADTAQTTRIPHF